MMSRIVPRLVVLGVGLALILLMAQGLGAQWRSKGSTARASYLYELERKIFRLTNEVRSKHGVPPLTWETSFRDVARAHSIDMLRGNYFSHLSPGGRSPHDRIRSGYPFALSSTGENIWMGTGYDPRNTNRLARIIMDNWMSSAGHRQNLLNPEFTDIGVGAAARGKNIRVTQVFVRTRKSK
ncbi:MAG: CAP domain-containing protein [Syntrophobacterales bacterium]|jgi:uncharacterized protein YkwD